MQLNNAHIYLDYNASAPMPAQVRGSVAEALQYTGNPSSVHAMGRKLYHLLSVARQNVADLVGAMPDQVVFTSGGTEANFLGIKGAVAKTAKIPFAHILVGATEHPCVLAAVEQSGIPFDIIPVDRDGIVDLEQLDAQLSHIAKPCLVCVMMANNETGTCQPISEIEKICLKHRALLHVDAVQAAGKLALQELGLGVCRAGGEVSGLVSISLSAHKIGGPQGVGALVLKDGHTIAPLLAGGGQEQGRRSGTENMAGIIGFGEAAKLAKQNQDAENARQKELRDLFEEKLTAMVPDVVIFSQKTKRLNNTSCFALPGVLAEKALINLDLEGVCLSSGSACSSGKVAHSHVLRAMGVDDAQASCALRLSLGWETTISDIEKVLIALEKITARLSKRAEKNEIA